MRNLSFQQDSNGVASASSSSSRLSNRVLQMEIHGFLHRQTASMWAVAEETLRVLVEFEGVELDHSSS
ncbi:MAG: hypothetical protein P1V20_29370 [Verrucomicrobiales bacterium]|nr:hypothetical protein [Verrucomicrobiales bacterium]